MGLPHRNPAQMQGRLLSCLASLLGTAVLLHWSGQSWRCLKQAQLLSAVWMVTALRTESISYAGWDPADKGRMSALGAKPLRGR